MEVSRLDRMVLQYYDTALAPSTLRTYRSAQTRYFNFCSAVSISPLPVNERHVCQFVATLAAEHVSHSSIKGYLSALRHLQISRVGEDPNLCSMAVLGYVLQGIKRSQAFSSGGGAGRTRLPVTVHVMRALKHSWEASGVSADKSML